MTKKTPYRKRYESTHPVISARVDMDTYTKLRKMVESEGKSLAGFLKSFIKKQKMKWDGAYRVGYRAGREEHRLWYYCNVCGEKLYMTPNDEDHKKMIIYMKEHGWGHTECHEKSE